MTAIRVAAPIRRHFPTLRQRRRPRALSLATSRASTRGQRHRTAPIRALMPPWPPVRATEIEPRCPSPLAPIPQRSILLRLQARLQRLQQLPLLPARRAKERLATRTWDMHPSVRPRTVEGDMVFAETKAMTTTLGAAASLAKRRPRCATTPTMLLVLAQAQHLRRRPRLPLGTRQRRHR